MNDELPDDALRIFMADWILYGTLPPVRGARRAVYDFCGRYESEAAMHADLAPELNRERGTFRYQRWAAGLPPMEPPSLEQINTVFRALSGDDLSIVKQIKSN